MVAKALQNEPAPFKYNIGITKMRKEEFTVAKHYYSMISIMTVNTLNFYISQHKKRTIVYLENCIEVLILRKCK